MSQISASIPSIRSALFGVFAGYELPDFLLSLDEPKLLLQVHPFYNGWDPLKEFDREIRGLNEKQNKQDL